MTARHDYHPFGEEVGTLAVVPGSPQPRTTALGYQSDSVRQKFTGYERDSETELDFAQARYYSFRHGRFMGVDAGPFTLADPQSFNRYAHVQNSPIKFTDSTGRKIELSGSNAQDFLNYLEKNSGLKFKTKIKNGVIIITGASTYKNFTGKVNKEFANVVKLEVERKILSEALGKRQDIRYEPRSQNAQIRTGEVIFFVYTDVQFDVIIQNDGSAFVKRISPPTVKRPKK